LAKIRGPVFFVFHACQIGGSFRYDIRVVNFELDKKSPVATAAGKKLAQGVIGQASYWGQVAPAGRGPWSGKASYITVARSTRRTAHC